MCGTIVLGFDPGGLSGAAIWRVGSKPISSSHLSVDSALDWFRSDLIAEIPTAAGIHTLLCWQTGKGGLRQPDQWLRDRYKEVSNSVVPPNSLYGAMAVQGMAMAMRLRQCWPDVKLNETHPKVLCSVKANLKDGYADDLVGWLRGQEESFSNWKPRNEHERDALISAWATYQGLTGNWTTDLMPQSGAPLFPAGRATYFWPPEV